MEKFGYIYKTTHIESGKIYIGQKKSPKFVKSYKGSGKYITCALEKYGFDAFDTIILEWCYSQDELNNKEKYWIKYYRDLNTPMYNIADGAVGGDIYHTLDRESQEKFKQKIKLFGHFSVETPEQRNMRIKKAVGTRRKGKGWVISDAQRELLRIKNTGKQLSPEVKEKIRQANLGKTLSEEHKRKISESNKGRQFTEEQKQCVSKGLKNYYKTHENPFKGKQHTETAKKIIGEKAKEIVKNLIWVNDGIKSTRVPKEKLQEYLNLGYIMGRLSYKCPTQKGRKLSETHKQNLSKAGKGKKHNRKLTPEEKDKMKKGVQQKIEGTLRLKKDNQIKHVKFDEVFLYLENGWELPLGAILVQKDMERLWISKFFLYEYLEKGYRIIERPKLKGDNQFKIFVNKDGIINRIDQSELEYYISQGYKLGKT